MERPGQKIPPYFQMGQGFFHFIVSESVNGNKLIKHAMIILQYMVDISAKQDGFYYCGKRLGFGECFTSRNKVANKLGMTENEARDALEYLITNCHIWKNKFKKSDNKLGTAYFVTGLTNPEYYEITKPLKNDENIDITDKNADNNVNANNAKSPSTEKKSPSENNETDEESSMFSETDGTENHQNNIRVPIENNINNINFDNISPKKRVSCDFEQFKTLPLLEAFVSAHTQRSKGERNKYICPFCGSGTGKNGTGALSIDKKRVKVHCFSGKCGFDGDIYDFAGSLFQTNDKIEQYKIVSEFSEKRRTRRTI